MTDFDSTAYNDPVSAADMVAAGRIPGPNPPANTGAPPCSVDEEAESYDARDAGYALDITSLEPPIQFAVKDADSFECLECGTTMGEDAASRHNCRDA